jgi:hypothetical protein
VKLTKKETPKTPFEKKKENVNGYNFVLLFLAEKRQTNAFLMSINVE